ncbi:MAG: DUF3175 domain-containing protein [Oligoflexia bacterium]|nr:DUF3175 domain-containing protein [Oligoflexia bacterium]
MHQKPVTLASARPAARPSANSGAVVRPLRRSAPAGKRMEKPLLRSVMEVMNSYWGRMSRDFPGFRKKIIRRAKLEFKKYYGKSA